VSPGTIALIVIAVSIAGWGLFMANVTIRRQRAAAKTRSHPAAGEGAALPTGQPAAGGATAGGDSADVAVQTIPAERLKPLTREQMEVSRRQFLNRAWTMSFSAFLGFFGLSTLSFLWPTLTGGFGTKITAGDYEELLKEIGPENNYTPKFIAEGRFWLAYYDGNPAGIPVYVVVQAQKYKMQALYRKCVHLGCSVPKCDTSKLFECPCHGSKYRLSGEYYGGPAPRGLDRFPITVEGGKVVVDTGDLQEGPPRGTNTWDKFSEPVGPFCVPV
jgi:cytochrome b6-f complex iron-sulfur subunit